jgi:hypothetical protein
MVGDKIGIYTIIKLLDPFQKVYRDKVNYLKI